MKRINYKIVGNVLLMLSLYYVIQSIIGLKINLAEYFLDIKFLGFAALLIAIITGIIYLNAYVYKNILTSISDKDIGLLEINNVYISSNIAKYMPGNVMHFVGRNVIGKKYGIEHKQLAIATVIELLFIIISCLALAAITGFEYMVTSLSWLYSNYTQYLTVLTFLILIAVPLVTFFMRKKGILDFKAIFNKDNVPIIIKTFTLDVVIFTLTSITYVMLVKKVIGIELSISSYLTVFSVYLISWLFGFVTPGAPGGIGIREAILIMLLAGIIDEKAIVISTVLHRCITVIADLAAFVIIKIYLRYQTDPC